MYGLVQLPPTIQESRRKSGMSMLNRRQINFKPWELNKPMSEAYYPPTEAEEPIDTQNSTITDSQRG